MVFSEDDESQPRLPESGGISKKDGHCGEHEEVRLETRSGSSEKWAFGMDFSVFFPVLAGKAGNFVVLGGVFS
jgi:hypothetical protein